MNRMFTGKIDYSIPESDNENRSTIHYFLVRQIDLLPLCYLLVGWSTSTLTDCLPIYINKHESYPSLMLLHTQPPSISRILFIYSSIYSEFNIIFVYILCFSFLTLCLSLIRARFCVVWEVSECIFRGASRATTKRHAITLFLFMFC